MGRRRVSKPPANPPLLCRRFEWLLRHEFGNSVKFMATEIGASNAALSRVINHGQVPNTQMIQGLARLGRVDMNWLLGGDAEPPPHRPTHVAFLPVSDRLLADRIGANAGPAGPVGLPTASPYAVGEGYWFSVPTDSPLATRETEKVVAGDFLLIATGSAWTARPEAYAGRHVVLRHPEKQEGFLVRVGDTDFFAEPSAYDLDTFGEFPNAQLTTGARPSSAAPAAKAARVRGGDRLFYPDDVVGVVLEKRTFYPRKRV